MDFRDLFRNLLGINRGFLPPPTEGNNYDTPSNQNPDNNIRGRQNNAPFDFPNHNHRQVVT